jgi:segregation and condensation protein B
VSSEENEESLAAQAAAWVPPWERRREPDRDYQDAVDAPQELPEGDDEELEPEPSEDELGPELPLPESVEEAAEEADDADEDEHLPVDAPAVAEESTPEPVAAVVTEPVVAELIVAEPVVAEPVVAEPIVAEPIAVEPIVAGPAEPVAEKSAPVSVPAQARGPRDDLDALDDDSARTPVFLDDAELAAALESIMLVVDEPVGELQLAQVMEVPVERIARTLEDVSARYTAAGHGIDLRRVAGGWRLYTRPEYAQYVERFVLDGQSVRLTQAALETLSVVAYKQPVTRSRISAIRGVNCDGVMRTLVTRGLIEEVGTEPETGAYLYRTTVLFLEKLGLNSVDQLPPLAPFLPDDVEEVLDASG